MVGERVSHYKIIEKIGSGGMGEIYRAEDVTLKRTVALKFLPQSISFDEEAKKRFLTEAQSASSLDHPNICTIYESGITEDSRPFISMALYEGETLKEKISKGKIEIKEAINIAVHICKGLDKAHQKNIIHRDIKPANIFITEDGIIKILDFGLAKIKDQSQLTQVGTTVGTIAYMSPEQATGSKVDQRTDIWSLGAVIFEMISGSQPFTADYEQAVIYSILNEKPDFSKIPGELIPILQKALTRSPDDRYNDIKEMMMDLGSLKNGTIPVNNYSFIKPIKIKFKTKLLALVLFFFALASVLYFYLNTTAAYRIVKPERKMIVVLPFENLGPPEDEYFVQGMREEISNKLASLGSIGVISRKSGEKFANSEKSIKEIGSELGVDYILEGTVQWAKNNNKTNRIRIIPQLVRVSDNINIWSDSYDRILNDIFDVQNDIAQKVVDRISDSLVSDKFKKIISPTENMGAYTYYLKGMDIENRPYVLKEDYFERLKLFKKAVELDPKFALAYAHLSITKSGMYKYYFDRTEKTLAEAFQLAQEALQIDPNLADAHFAFADYYNCRKNNSEAEKEYNKVLKIKPNDADALSSVAGIYSSRGDFKSAIQYLSNAFSLDPLSFDPLFGLAELYRFLRDYKNAEKYYKIFIEKHPDLPFIKAPLALNYIDWKGDIKKASELIRNFKSVDEDYFNYDYTVSVYIDVLNRDYDHAIKTLMPLNKDTNDELTGYTLKKMELGLIYKFKNDLKKSRLYFDSTRIQIEKMYRENPLEERLHTTLGVAYAGLGNKERALAECEKGIELNTKKSVLAVYNCQSDLVTIYILLGEYDNALNKIDFLLSHPGELSVKRLKLDPIYDPLRNLTGFKRIIEKYS